MASPFAQRVSAILRSGLTPLLRSHGFRKHGQVYVSERGDVLWIVDVQKSRWNDGTEAQFTINGGVYVPGVVSAYSRRPEPSIPKLVDCCLSVRIGMLDDSKLDKWWKVTASDAPEDAVDEQISTEIRDRVGNHLLPFLQRFESSVEVAEFLEGPMNSATCSVSPRSLAQRHAYASLIYLRLGNTAKARSEIDEAVREAEGTPIDEVIKRLRAHIFSS